MPAGDYANTRFSPLDQINNTNVKSLKVITTLSTGIPHGHEGQPLIVNNTMYVVTPFPNNLIAVDLTKPGGALKWVYQPNPNPRAVGIACCDLVNRGASFADGKIVYNTLDAHTVAVDAATGKEVWRAYNTGPDSDVLIGAGFHAFYAKDQGTDLGAKSWPPDQWKLGGSTVWGWVSYDPELNLIYYGTGNPCVWNPDLRPGDNKWSLTIFARDADTGQARWAYQVTPHDHWDYDEIMENVLVDMEWGGRMRKLLLHPARNGFMFVLDRETGEVLSAELFVPSTNWATGYDLQTGLPNMNPAKKTQAGVVTQDICPSSTGAKEFVPSALSPRTGLLYIPAHNTCMDYEGVEANYIAGTPYLGASVRMHPGPGGYQGEMIAWDVKNARQVWGIKDEKFPVYSGVLATGGDVVFYGTMEGWFRAVHSMAVQDRLGHRREPRHLHRA